MCDHFYIIEIWGFYTVLIEKSGDFMHNIKNKFGDFIHFSQNKFGDI